MNKKTAILLTSIFSVVIICGAVFAFQKNGQPEVKKGVLLEEFGNNGFRSAQNSGDDKQEKLIDYSAQAVLVESGKSDKKQNLNLTRTLEFFAKTGKDLFEMKRELVFQPINKIVEFRKNAKEDLVEFKIIKVPEDYEMIQLAIDNADFGDTVKVSAGEYNENIVMKEGVSLIGSNVLEEEGMEEDMEEEEEETETEEVEDYEAPELDSAFSLRFVIANETIINGKNSGNVVSFKNRITNKTRLANFTIKNAGKNLSGILIEDSSPVICDNIITNNEYNIYIKGDSAPIIQKNSLRFGGKGIQVYNFIEEKTEQETELSSETSELSSVSFLDSPNIIDNLITDNKIGIDLYQASAIIDHNTISYNNHYKTYLGATFGIYVHNSPAKISNNIITDSGICDLCAGINVDEKSKDVILSYNNIWNNKSDFVCFGKCVLEDNNISEDPMFVNPANWNFELREESGLIGVGEEESDVGVRW